jgi:hypothetical protein
VIHVLHVHSLFCLSDELTGRRGSAALRAGRPSGQSSSPGRVKNFYWGALSLFSGHWGTLSLGVKRQEREADHTPPTSDEVNVRSPIVKYTRRYITPDD